MKLKQHPSYNIIQLKCILHLHSSQKSLPIIYKYGAIFPLFKCFYTIYFQLITSTQQLPSDVQLANLLTMLVFYYIFFPTFPFLGTTLKKKNGALWQFFKHISESQLV